MTSQKETSPRYVTTRTGSLVEVGARTTECTYLDGRKYSWTVQRGAIDETGRFVPVGRPVKCRTGKGDEWVRMRWESGEVVTQSEINRLGF